jgi:hypothetical protein
MSSDEYAELNQREAAERLAIKPRQLRNIPDEFTGRLASRLYPWPDLQKGYIRWKQIEGLQRRGLSRSPGQDAQARHLNAKARIAELQLAQLEERLLPVEVFREVIKQFCDRVYNYHKAIPGSWTPRLADALGVDPREVAKALQPLTTEAIDELSDVIADLVEPEDHEPPRREAAA